MRLGTLTLNNNLLLAPMQEVTTAPYRRFCRKFHRVGLVCVPMLYTKKIEKYPESFLPDLLKIEEENPISVQLIGSDIDALKKSIEFLESYKFDVLDINAGCPSRRAINAREGGYLLEDLERLERLINVALKYSSKPVSLKIRTGLQKMINIVKIIQVINKSGIDFLTIHGRTVSDKFNDSRLDVELIKKIKELILIPVVGNGDIDNPVFAKEFLDYTNVDALMIGRGSMGNPEIFGQISHFLTKGVKLNFKNDLIKMQKHIELYEKCIDEFVNNNANFAFPIEDYKFMELKRNSIWLTKNIKDSTDIRRILSKTKNLKELKQKLQQIYET